MPAEPDLSGTHVGWSLARLIQELKIVAFGRPPYVHRWHPRWTDYRVLLDTMHTLLLPQAGTLLVVDQNTVYLRSWISRLTADAQVLQTQELLDLGREDYSILLKRFQGSVVIVNENELRLCADLIERVLPLLAEGGFLMLAVLNGRAMAIHDGFAGNFAYWSTQFVNVHECVSSAKFVPATLLRATVLRWLIRCDKFVGDYPVLAPLLALPVGLLMLMSYAANRSTRESGSGLARTEVYSSVFMVFRALGWSRLPKFEKEKAGHWTRKQIDRQRAEPQLRAAPQVKNGPATDRAEVRRSSAPGESRCE
jgi:hypothetical protein